MKAAENIRDAFLRAIPVGQRGFLLPVCNAHLNDNELIQKMTDWRNINVDAYPTQFIASLESTRSWLKDKLLKVEDRILFFIIDNNGNVLGHIGFNSCINTEQAFEIDNVVRGVTLAEKGIFSEAIIQLIEWARKTINVNEFILRVMDNNLHAINFYKKNGFVTESIIPLKKNINNEFTNFEVALDGDIVDRKFVKMKWVPKRDKFQNTLILTAGPSISAREAVYAFDAANNGWNGNWSKYLTAFEKKFAEYVGVKHALATSSCTGALRLLNGIGYWSRG